MCLERDNELCDSGHTVLFTLFVELCTLPQFQPRRAVSFERPVNTHVLNVKVEGIFHDALFSRGQGAVRSNRQAQRVKIASDTVDFCQSGRLCANPQTQTGNLALRVGGEAVVKAPVDFEAVAHLEAKRSHFVRDGQDAGGQGGQVGFFHNQSI